MIPGVEVNTWAILVCAIVYMVIGSLWYSPLMFGKRWMHLSKITKQEGKGMSQIYGIAFVSALVMSFIIAHVVAYANGETFVEGMQIGFWLWLGLVAPVILGGTLWEGKPWELFLINAANYLVALVIVGGILAAW
jgi:hypothetical protein